MVNKIELSDKNFYIWDQEEKLNNESIESYIQSYLSGNELKRITVYNDYYGGDNTEILKYHKDRKNRRVTPNNCIPTGYYSTIIDTMAGFMFSNIQYTSEQESDENFIESLNAVLDNNNSDVKDMESGVNALAYNKAIELVYTVGDSVNKPEIKFTSIDPRQMLLIYNDDIEPLLLCGIRITLSNNKDYDYMIDVIYKDEWQYYYLKNGKLSSRKESKTLLFSECPVIVYRAEILTDKSPFNIVIPYIVALDNVVTGNSDDIDKLTDAILILTKMLDADTLKNLKELKAISGMDEKDRVEYVEKNNSPEFRQYVSKLLINEIHKHSHVVDWYNPDSGISGDASAKALRTRLFDMSMYSKRLEKVYIKGLKKRIKLIAEMMKITDQGYGNISIKLNREIPSEFLDLAPVLNNLEFISTPSKLEMLGMNVEKEIKKLDEEKTANVARFMQESRVTDGVTNEEDDN